MFFVIPTARNTAISFVCSKILAVIADTSEKNESAITIKHSTENTRLMIFFYDEVYVKVSL